MNIPQLAEDAFKRLGKRNVMVFEGKEVTNWDLLDTGRRLHRAFSRLGLSKEDVAVLCMMNHHLGYGVFQGILRTGGTAIPVMFMWTAPEVRHVVSDSRAQGVVTDLMNIDKIREAVEGLDHVKWIAVMDGEDRPDSSPPEVRLNTLLEEAPELNLPAIHDNDVALMLYTSGTTGRPKGVMLTHLNLISSAEAAAEASELDKREKGLITISAMPMAHIFGVGVMNGGYTLPEHMADGYTVQLAWFEPERFMQLIQEHRCQSFPAVPTMLALILAHPSVDQYDLSSLEEVICGAAPLPPEQFGLDPQEIREKFSDYVERYGV